LDKPYAHCDLPGAAQIRLIGKGSPYLITECRVPELIPVLGSQPAGDVSHKPGGRLPLLPAMPAVTLATLKGLCLFRQHHGCDLNPGPSAQESSMLTTRLPSHPTNSVLPQIWNILSKELTRGKHWGRSLMCTIALFVYHRCVWYS